MKNLFSLLILLLAAGCSSVEEEISPLTQTPVDVYIAGQKNNHACYWKNNQPILLTDGLGAQADTVAVVNNHVHVFGKQNFDNFTTNYLYWKNNVKTNLSETLSTPSHMLIKITGMDVVGNDVYFVGYTKNPLITAEIYELAYWKNGVKTELGGATNPTFKSKIKVANGVVCVISKNGYYVNGVFNSFSSNIGLIGITSKNNEIYVYGENYSQNTAFYKNIVSQNETNVSNINRCFKLIFDNNDTYISNGSNIFKNNILLYSSSFFSFYIDFEILNNNNYILKREGDFGTTDVLYINNVNVLQVFIGEGKFNSILVVQN